MRSWHQPMRGNIKLLGQTRGKGFHENSRERSSCDENERVKRDKRSSKKLAEKRKEKGQTFLLHQNHLSSISLGQAFYWIWRKVTSLYNHFMRLLLLNVLGNVTDSLLLCDAAGPPGMSILFWKLRLITSFCLWY